MPPTEDDDLSLEAELGAALDGAGIAPEREEEQPAAPAAKAKGEAAFPKSEDLPPKRDYVREGRRFVPKEEPKEGAPDPAVAKPKEGEPPKADAPVKQWKPLWYKEEYGPWDKLAEPFRNALREQERNAAQAIEKHSTTAKAWEPVNKLLEPHMQELRAAGVEPQQYVTNLINADAYLRADPVKAMNWLAQQYTGMDIIDLANKMDAMGVQPDKVDPLKQEVGALKARLSNYENQGQNAQRAALETQIQDWAKDKPHFEDVRELMASLARAPVNKGASLDQLYDAALHAHPQLRQRILEDKRRDEVQRARTAGATSPRTSSVPNGALRSKPTMSLEEEIGSLYDGGTV